MTPAGTFVKASPTLAKTLDAHTREGELCERLEDNRLECFACGHHCLILEGRRGICKVRFNRGGRLLVPTGYVGALQCDPTEKKPFFHVFPGSDTLTFGMLGCDYHCGYCQNWLTSQALRDPRAEVMPREMSAEQLVYLAKSRGAKVVGSSYNEPLITAEWAVEVFRVAKAEGFLTAFISNGNGTPEVLKYLRPWTDLYKVDLKSMSKRAYRKLGGQLKTVLETIPRLVEMGFWVEIVTLVIPGFNDSDAELREAASFLAGISADIPWHVTAFHKDYKMVEPDNTNSEALMRAVQIGKECGLHFVYGGNLPGQVGPYENTCCPDCHTVLVERFGYQILQNRLSPEGLCPSCGRRIPGIW